MIINKLSNCKVIPYFQDEQRGDVNFIKQDKVWSLVERQQDVVVTTLTWSDQVSCTGEDLQGSFRPIE